MDEKLLSKELGISSIADLHRVTTDRHEDIKELLSVIPRPQANLSAKTSQNSISHSKEQETAPQRPLLL